MKKLLVWLLVGVFLFTCNVVQAAASRKIHIIDQLLDADPTSITGSWDMSNYKKVMFFVDYDETDLGTNIEIAITAHISHDNTNFIAYSWYDMASLTTLVTSEVMDADGNYVGWFEPDRLISIVRITITATTSDADNTAEVDCYILGIE